METHAHHDHLEVQRCATKTNQAIALGFILLLKISVHPKHFGFFFRKYWKGSLYGSVSCMHGHIYVFSFAPIAQALLLLNYLT